ncbi:MAG: AlpA family phage regulatory protein [Campylobacteraceae bacterium]|jgi:predicted DNA-binding transcriptional regulator AlpA|nr:AlpA family phage regulatory protein [Campylobacteraceae bacterium]
MNEDRFIDIKEVLKIVGCKITTWYNLVSDNKAPQPYRPYGTRSVRWSYFEIQKWIADNKGNNGGNQEQLSQG